jgi:hypothetical protein
MRRQQYRCTLSGTSLHAIDAALGISGVTVREVRAGAGVPRRGRGEANLKRWPRRRLRCQTCATPCARRKYLNYGKPKFCLRACFLRAARKAGN